jgi:hypothetical protein
MRHILLLMALCPMLCFGQQSIPYLKGEYGYDINADKPVQGFSAEYTYLKDIASYYNARLFGFTVGAMYDKYKWSVPFYYTVKVSEWNEVARIGVILDEGTKDLDFKGIRLHGSYGFDNIFTRRRTDGRLWSIEGYVRYGKNGFEAGGRLGVGFVFDKYHTRIWYNNY